MNHDTSKMRVRLNERSQVELLKLMELMGLTETSPSYALQKVISQQYEQLKKNPEREVKNNANQESKAH